MAKYKTLCVLLVAFSSVSGSTKNKQVLLNAVDDVRMKLIDLEKTLWRSSLVDNQDYNNTQADIELCNVFLDFDKNIREVTNNGKTTPEVFGLENSWRWEKVKAGINDISRFYTNFIEFMSRQIEPMNVPSPIGEWLDMAESILKRSSNKVGQIDTIVIHENLFGAVITDEHPELCNLQQSPHQLLFNMYNKIMLTEIKGYAMMQFSWMLLKIYGKGNFTQEANLMRQRYEERSASMVTSVKNAMKITTREMLRCDPDLHEEGQTYVQVTKLLQGYIENEVDMNPKGTCWENCAYYSRAEHQDCYKDQFCSKQSACEGKILSCQYIDSDMTICPAPKSSTRRYEWISYENGRNLGKTGSCMGGVPQKVDSWWRGVVHCSYCFCLCEDSKSLSHRYFSLHEVLSDIETNKVVTGIKFLKMNQVIHLQISQGILLPKSTIDHTSVHWKPVDVIDVDDFSTQDGVDYHTLTYENRAIDLDDVEGPTGYVLTGVRFRMLGAHLNLEVRVTPYNFTTGKLLAGNSIWRSNHNTDTDETKPRQRLVLEKPDIPTRKHGVRYPVDSKHNQFLEFTHSDIDADVAQTTIPFIDIQPVLPTKAVPLTGAGIYHRGTKGSGGFIAPKIFTYDYSTHLHASTPSEEYTISSDIEFVSRS